jgi:hypothetical protein
MNISIHDLEVENIIENKLICTQCLETKQKILSNCDENNSIIDIGVNTNYLTQINTMQNNCFIVKPDMSYVNEATEEEECESEIDPEEKIQSSWYHRAILGDENRQIYDDGEDTDFEAVEEYWRLVHEAEAEFECNELADDFNAQLVEF